MQLYLKSSSSLRVFALLKALSSVAKLLAAQGEKCPRCWNFRELGGNANHPHVCKRCGDALDAIGFEGEE